METFSALLAICMGNSPVPGEFPAQRPVTWSFDVFFDLRLNKRLSKQWWGWWFETLSLPLWRSRNEYWGASISCKKSPTPVPFVCSQLMFNANAKLYDKFENLLFIRNYILYSILNDGPWLLKVVPRRIDLKGSRYLKHRPNPIRFTSHLCD